MGVVFQFQGEEQKKVFQLEITLKIGKVKYMYFLIIYKNSLFTGKKIFPGIQRSFRQALEFYTLASWTCCPDQSGNLTKILRLPFFYFSDFVWYFSSFKVCEFWRDASKRFWGHNSWKDFSWNFFKNLNQKENFSFFSM